MLKKIVCTGEKLQERKKLVHETQREMVHQACRRVFLAACKWKLSSSDPVAVTKKGATLFCKFYDNERLLGRRPSSALAFPFVTLVLLHSSVCLCSSLSHPTVCNYDASEIRWVEKERD